MDEGEAGPSAKRQRGAAAAAQNAQLFAEAGQFNPHAARAERKARKKGAVLRQAWAEAEAEAGGESVVGGEVRPWWVGASLASAHFLLHEALARA